MQAWVWFLANGQISAVVAVAVITTREFPVFHCCICTGPSTAQAQQWHVPRVYVVCHLSATNHLLELLLTNGYACNQLFPCNTVCSVPSPSERPLPLPVDKYTSRTLVLGTTALVPVYAWRTLAAWCKSAKTCPASFAITRPLAAWMFRAG